MLLFYGLVFASIQAFVLATTKPLAMQVYYNDIVVFSKFNRGIRVFADFFFCGLSLFLYCIPPQELLHLVFRRIVF